MTFKLKCNILLLFSYIVGLFFGNLILSPLLKEMAYVTLVGGAFITFPAFLLLVGIFNLFFENIRKYIIFWAVLTPVLVTFLWVIFEVGYFETEYISKAFFERSLVAFTCSSIAALYFYIGYCRINSIFTPNE